MTIAMFANADAHGAQGVASGGFFQLVQRGGDQACTAHAQRVAEGDGTAVAVDPLVVVSQAELAQYREALGGKGLVELDDVHVGQRQPDKL